MQKELLKDCSTLLDERLAAFKLALKDEVIF